MIEIGRPYTMGFKDALMYGIDYRDYEKVSTLPAGVYLAAIAGVWGDYSNIRCLFMTEDGKGYPAPSLVIESGRITAHPIDAVQKPEPNEWDEVLK